MLHGGLQVGAQDLGVEGVLLHRQGLVIKPLQLQQKLLLVGQRRPGGEQGWYSQIYCCIYFVYPLCSPIAVKASLVPPARDKVANASTSTQPPNIIMVTMQAVVFQDYLGPIFLFTGCRDVIKCNNSDVQCGG